MTKVKYSIELRSIPEVDCSSVKQFSFERDNEAWISVWVDTFGLPEDEVSGFLDQILTNKRFLHLVVLYEQSKLIGTSALFEGGDLMAIYGREEIHLRKILGKIKELASRYDIDMLRMTSIHVEEEDPKLQMFRNIGFSKE